MSIKMLLFRVVVPVVVAIVLTQTGFKFNTHKVESKSSVQTQADVKSTGEKLKKTSGKRMTKEMRNEIFWKSAGMIILCVIGLSIAKKLMLSTVRRQFNNTGQRF